MIRIARLIIFCMLCVCSFCYSSSYSISDCITYESSSSLKWCRYSTSTSYGYKCTTSEYNSACGGSSSYRCSTDSSYLPQNAKKLLCPTDYSNCYTQSAYLYSSSDYQSLSSSYFGTSTFCWYKFTPYSSYIKSISIKINSMSNANAEVYLESSTNSFTYKGSVSNGGSISVNVGYYDPVWVLVTPVSSSAYVRITATASSSSTSDSTTGAILAAILVPAITCGVYLVFGAIIFLICFVSRKRRLVSHQNATSAVIITPSPAPAPVPFTQPPRPVLQPQPQYFAQPQMNYPPQQNYNNMYQSQPQVVMGSALPAYPQPSPMPTQQIYVLEPVPNEPVQQMGYLPSEQIYAPNPSEMKQKDYDEYKPV